MTIGEGVENFLQERLKDSEGLLVGLNSGGCTGFTVSLLKKDLSDSASIRRERIARDIIKLCSYR